MARLSACRAQYLHFLIFYARVPEGFRKVDNVSLENGSITIEDRSGAKPIVLAASKGL